MAVGSSLNNEHLTSGKKSVHPLIPEEEINSLNERYKALNPLERIKSFYNDQGLVGNSEYVVLTSSFGTTSAILLHLFYQAGIDQKVYFLNSGYHFRETVQYKEKLTGLLNLNVEELYPEQWKHDYSRTYQLWKSEPDLCCSINKVEPLEKVKENAKIWVSGLMGWQNEFRNNLDIFQKKKGLIKFYPIIDWSENRAWQYIEDNKLPHHPLKGVGYESVGCVHCTFKGKRRQGRWANLSKTECGLHN